jgi:hypothetical protein
LLVRGDFTFLALAFILVYSGVFSSWRSMCKNLRAFLTMAALAKNSNLNWWLLNTLSKPFYQLQHSDVNTKDIEKS